MTDKKKVVMVGSVPPPYHGSNVYFYNLINSRINEEFEITHLDISDHRNLDNLSRLDFTNVYLALKSILKLFLTVIKERPAIVYIPVSSNFLPYLRDGIFILTASYFSKSRIIIHLHEGDYFKKEFYTRSNFAVRYFIRKSLSKVTTAIVYSESLKNNFKGFVKNIVAFPNGLDPVEITVLESNGVSNEKIKVGFYSNLFESKGVLDTLNAAALVSKVNPNIEFAFTGEWTKPETETKVKAEKIIKENNLEKTVTFIGTVSGDKKKKFLNETDIIAFPTWYPYEGCPMVIIEAMAYGRPVISTRDVGAIPEMISDGETGFLVDKKKPEQIADAIIKLANDPALIGKMGRSAREKFEKQFTMNKNVDNIINTFTKALN